MTASIIRNYLSIILIKKKFKSIFVQFANKRVCVAFDFSSSV